LNVSFKVLQAVPMIASILTEERATQELLTTQIDLSAVIDRLTLTQIHRLQQHPLIQQLIEFLSGVTRQIA
ncbi:MAG: hypothetical protein PUP92_05020, partial [Rhizonema sp. PD38]|nr:hypothetical protein [Rhizonema sp. PD38]